MAKITHANFTYATADKVPSEKNSQVAFMRANPDTRSVMVRPDRPFDQEAHRYRDADERARGNAAMRRWFEYLAQKGLQDKGFLRTIKTLLGIMKAGRSIQFVCDDPGVFDKEFEWRADNVLASDFWDEFEISRIPVARGFENREKFVAALREVVSELRMNRPKERHDREPRAAFKSVSVGQPQPAATLSEEVRRKMGLIS